MWMIDCDKLIQILGDRGGGDNDDILDNDNNNNWSEWGSVDDFDYDDILHTANNNNIEVNVWFWCCCKY